MRSQAPRHVLAVVILVAVGTISGAGAESRTVDSEGPVSSTAIAYDDGRPGAATGKQEPDRSRYPVRNSNFTVPDPDHRIDATVFPRLWSGDDDEPTVESGDSMQSVLLSATDYAFGHPPAAVETWNAGDHREFPRTDENASVYPPNASLTDALWIEDAYIDVFAIQPSTVVHVSPNDTQYFVRRFGAVLATTDYRIGLPPDQHHDYDPSASDRGEASLVAETVEWDLLDHEMSDVTLEADGQEVATTGPTHTPRLDYDSIPPSTDRLTVSATISTTIERTIRRKFRNVTGGCDTPTIEIGNETLPVTGCDGANETVWTTVTNRSSHSVTVRDTVDVDVYELGPTATRARFIDGSSALAVSASTGDPWTAYRLPDGRTVHNIWHFYSARNRHWDSLIESTEANTTYRSSDAIPLQVHAFPSRGGAYTGSEFGAFEVTRIWGDRRRAPLRPDNVTVPFVEESYATGRTVVVSADGGLELDGPVTVHGLVRGTQAQLSVRETRTQRPASLDLTLLRVNRSAGMARVHVSLREEATGEPIDLESRPGVVRVHGVVVAPNSSGEAVVTVPLAGAFVSAEYDPGPWWATDPVYSSDRASVSPPTQWPDPRRLVSAGVGILLWLSPVLFVIFLVDRLLGRGRLWPPWRGIR